MRLTVILYATNALISNSSSEALERLCYSVTGLAIRRRSQFNRFIRVAKTGESKNKNQVLP